MLPRHQPDRIQIAFDDHRLVANAGLLLPATLASTSTFPLYLDFGDGAERGRPAFPGSRQTVQ